MKCIALFLAGYLPHSAVRPWLRKWYRDAWSMQPSCHLSVQHITHDCKLCRVLRCWVGAGVAIALSRDARRPVVCGPAASESTAVLASARRRPLGSSGTSGSLRAGCAPSAIARAPPPSSASAGAPGGPNWAYHTDLLGVVRDRRSVGQQPARCTLLVSSFAPPRAELTPVNRRPDPRYWCPVGATSRCAHPRLRQDRPAAPEERGLRASDQRGLVPKPLGSAYTSRGGWEVAHAWLRGASCPRMCVSAYGPLVGSRGVFPCLGTTSAAPLSLREPERVRVGRARGVLQALVLGDTIGGRADIISKQNKRRKRKRPVNARRSRIRSSVSKPPPPPLPRLSTSAKRKRGVIGRNVNARSVLAARRSAKTKELGRKLGERNGRRGLLRRRLTRSPPSPPSPTLTAPQLPTSPTPCHRFQHAAGHQQACHQQHPQ